MQPIKHALISLYICIDINIHVTFISNVSNKLITFDCWPGEYTIKRNYSERVIYYFHVFDIAMDNILA